VQKVRTDTYGGLTGNASILAILLRFLGLLGVKRGFQGVQMRED
jgi:hypothetical protein